jgi:hypothetical protein
LFTPRRERARLCSARCRVAWNREHIGDPQAEARALDWSIAAMRDAMDRLAIDQAPGHVQALTVISEAVWKGDHRRCRPGPVSPPGIRERDGRLRGAGGD